MYKKLLFILLVVLLLVPIAGAGDIALKTGVNIGEKSTVNFSEAAGEVTLSDTTGLSFTSSSVVNGKLFTPELIKTEGNELVWATPEKYLFIFDDPKTQFNYKYDGNTLKETVIIKEPTELSFPIKLGEDSKIIPWYDGQYKIVSASTGDTMNGLIAEKPYGLDADGKYIPMEYKWDEGSSSLNLIYSKSVSVYNEKLTIANGIDEKTGLYNKPVYEDIPITYPLTIDPTWTSAGGCWTNVSGSYTIVMWNATGSTTWTVPTGVTSVEYLVVAGGGAGGGSSGGGGGAGGMLTCTTYSVTAGTNLTVAVGTGGVPNRGNGTNSTFDTIYAKGGGGGGTGYGATAGLFGGSGGGGTVNTPTGGDGIAGQGKGGGRGAYGYGSGGGAGANGTLSGGDHSVTPPGGIGLNSTITGENVTYAGGGGAGSYATSSTPGAGGAGGGGAGTNGNGPAGYNGTNGLGGGGGGGGRYNTGTPNYNGGYGGSGIVIIKYSTPITFISNFTSNVTVGTIYPMVVQFNDTSLGTNIDKWNWSFGDGRWFNTTTSSLANTTYQYAVAKKYNVSLIINDTTSGQNTTTKVDYINLTSDYDANVTSWLHMNGTNGSTTFSDETGIAWTRNPGSIISTLSPKYGGASGYFPAASSSYISTPNSSAFQFGTGDFTIEFWMNVTSVAGTNEHVFSKTNNPRSQGWGMDRTNSGAGDSGWDFYMGNDSGGQVFFNAPITNKTWVHIAIERISGTIYLYVDGNLTNSSAGFNANYDTSDPLWIGRQQSNYYNGFVDEFRISKGNARWRSNFTPPYNQYNGLVETIYPDINPNSTFRYKTDPGGDAYLDNMTQRNRTLQIQNVTNTSYVVGEMIFNPLYGYVKSVQLNTSYYASGMTLVSSNIDNTEGLIQFNISKPTGFSPGTDRASILDYTIAYVNYTDGTDIQDTFFGYGYLINGTTNKTYGVHNFLGTAPVYGDWNFTANFTANLVDVSVGDLIIFNATFNGSYPNRWNWSFGDGSYDNGTNSTTTHSYLSTGLKTVSVMEYLWQNGSVNNTKTRTDYINVTSPIANFTGTPTIGVAPLNVYFTDISNGSYNWANWSFGDGAYQNLTKSTTYGHDSIAINSSGYLYKMDTATNSIKIFDINKNLIGQWGTTGSGDGEFSYAYDIAVNSSGYVFVADSGNNRIQVFDPSGTFVRKWGTLGSGDGQFSVPRGIAVNSSGYVYVADIGNERIQVFDASGTYVTQWSVSGIGNVSVATNSSGYVYITEESNSSVLVTDASGTYVRLWGSYGTGDGEFDSPLAITVNGSGYVYVADFYNDRIQVFDPSGTFVRKWGSLGTDNGNFSHVYGIDTNSSEYVYATDFQTTRIQIFDASGTYLTKFLDDGLSIYHTYSAVANYTVGLTIGNSYITNETIKIDYIRVYPPFIASFTSNATSGTNATAVQFTDITSYEYWGAGPFSWWNFTDVTGNNTPVQFAIFVGGGSTPVHTFGIGNYSIQLYASSVGDTNLSPQVTFINVSEMPAPIADFTTNVSSGLFVLGVGFNDTTTSLLDAWNWSFGDGTYADTNNTQHLYTTGGVYTVILNVSNAGGWDNKSADITVYNRTNASFNINISSGVEPLPVLFTNTSSNATGWNWSFRNATGNNTQVWFNQSENPVHIFNVGNYSIVLNASNSWDYNISIQNTWINVTKSPPIADFTTNVSSGLFPLAVGFNDTSTGTPTSWNWSFGDGTYADTNNTQHLYSSGGVYTVILNVSNAGGWDNKSADITVYNHTSVDFTASNVSGVRPVIVNFTDISTNATGWLWYFGDGNTSTDRHPTFTYDVPGNFSVNHSAYNTWDDSWENKTGYINISQIPAPTADFSMNVSSGLFPLDVGFNDTSTGSPTSWNWSFGDGTYASTNNTQHLYATGGNFTVVLNASNVGGNSYKTKYVEIFNRTNASFVANITSGIAPQGVIFNVTGRDNGTQWNWSFGDGVWQNGTTQNATHTYTTNGVFTVNLTVSNPYNTSFVSIPNYITVYIPPVASFTTNATSGIEPEAIQFTDTSINTPTSWNWSFQDVTGNNTQIWFSQVQDPAYIFNAGNYRIRLNATNIAGSNISSQVTFINISAPSLPPYASFTASPMSGNAPLPVVFTDTSANMPSTWWWDFGDGTNNFTQNTCHTYILNGNYQVWLNVSNVFGVSNTSKTINVFGINPVASFTVNNSSGGAGMAVAFTDTSSYTPGSVIWYWQFGNGDTSALQNPVYTYSSLGTYNVNLTVIDSIGSSLSPNTPIYVTGNISPIVDFVGTPLSSASAPLTVTFTDLSLGTKTGWNWSFGEGNYSNAQNPVYTYNYNGQYTVTLIVANGTDTNSTTKIGYINVGVAGGTVYAEFSGTPVNGNVPHTVTFTDLSLCNPVCTNWAWDLNGDGATDSNAKNPTYTYTAPMTYSPRLIASNGLATGTKVRPGYITAGPVLVPTPLPSPTAVLPGGINTSFGFVMPEDSVDLPNSTYLSGWLQNFTATGNFSVYGFATSLMAPLLHLFGFWIYLIIWGLYLFAVWIRSQDVTLPLIIGIISMGTFGLLFPKESLPVIIIMFVVCGAIIITKLMKDSI